METDEASAKQALEENIRRERIVGESLPPLSARILEIAREHGRVTVAEAAKITSASLNAVEDPIKGLAGSGHPRRHGVGHLV